ncbi:MAG: S-layer homology domain-containing protein [Peptoniphilus lacrimalis]|uniref:S-layer homology domain-containing protein n=1 Tax=Peptoniphilus lacrimalis TaxID=33031 RepID=UPI00254D0AFD|nr:S-layer homology domain-containing protein [Peptoniphilus lacrimalis]MDK8281334.1 S-layer homology domain-containing protein [Peptoniphilus lacrimalis]
MNKKLISTITLSAILIAPTNILAKTFSDVNNNDWFYSVVNDLSDKGIISGYEDNTFKPQKAVSYAEFLTLLNNSIGEKQSPDYKNSEEWYKPTFDYLKNKGVIANIANPNAEITRNEMAKYLSLGLEKLKNQKIDTTTPASIKDFDSIPNEYKDLVASVVNAGLIKGDENQNFNGSKSLTRAETAVIIKGLGGGTTTPTPKKPEPKPVAQGTFPLPLEGKDKYGNPYKIQQSIVDEYPENRNPNLSGANAQQPIVNPDLLQEYGQKYLDKINRIISDPTYGRYGAYEKWAPSLIDRNTKSELDGEKLEEEDRAKGLTPLSDLDFSKMSEKELQDYL